MVARCEIKRFRGRGAHSYGNNMKQDGSLDSKRIIPNVYTPAGATQTLSLISNGYHYQIRFSADGYGNNTAFVDHAGAFHRWQKGSVAEYHLQIQR